MKTKIKLAQSTAYPVPIGPWQLDAMGFYKSIWLKAYAKHYHKYVFRPAIGDLPAQFVMMHWYNGWYWISGSLPSGSEIDQRHPTYQEAKNQWILIIWEYHGRLRKQKIYRKK